MHPLRHATSSSYMRSPTFATSVLLSNFLIGGILLWLKTKICNLTIELKALTPYIKSYWWLISITKYTERIFGKSIHLKYTFWKISNNSSLLSYHTNRYHPRTITHVHTHQHSTSVHVTENVTWLSQKRTKNFITRVHFRIIVFNIDKILCDVQFYCVWRHNRKQ